MSTDNWSRVEALFQEALEIAGEERTRFLDRSCSDDHELRREVESLIRAHEQAGGFLEDSIVRLEELGESGLLDSEPDQRIGPYRLLRELGEGVSTTVFLADRADAEYRQRVAIKLVKPGMGSGEILRRFQQERQILAALDHPNIAKILDGGRSDDGRPYFVMEYIEGLRIDDYCNRHRLAIDDRLELFRRVCGAIHYAHRNLVVHRDLKPANVLITADGDAKLLDFGIAKMLNPELSSQDLEPTSAVVRLMTPHYASPEQVRGEVVSTASDVYSLGVLLYELLTGERPYSLEGLNMSEIEEAIRQARPQPPSAAVRRAHGAPKAGTDVPAADPVSLTGGPERLARRLEGDLDTIVLKAIRKEPERRYTSVQELSDDLRRHLEDLPVLARRDTLGYRISKLVRRHSVAVVATGAVVLSLIAGTAVSVWQASVAREQRARAVAQRQRSDEVLRFVVDLFQVPASGDVKGSTITAREILDRGAGRIEGDFEDQPEVQATLMDTIGGVYFSLGLYDRAVQLMERALDTRVQSLGEEHPDVASNLNNLALAYQAQGRYEDAEELLRRSVDLHRSLFGPEHRDIATTLTNLASILNSQAKYEEAERLHREALTMARSLLGEEDPLVAASRNNLAVVLQLQGKHDEAERLIREVLAMQRRRFGNEHVFVATTLANLAAVQARQSRYDEAEQTQREALALQRELLGEQHPHVATGLNNLATLLTYQAEYEEAERLHREALALRRSTFGSEHPHVATSLNNLATLLTHREKYQEAADLFGDAVALERRLGGDVHPLLVTSLCGLAAARSELGDGDGAELLFREALALCRENLPEGHADTARALVGLGALLTDRGEPTAAEPMLQEAVAVARRVRGGSGWQLAVAESALGGCLTALGRPDEAEPLLLQSHAELEASLGARHPHRKRAVERLVELYESTGDRAAAARYRSLLSADS